MKSDINLLAASQIETEKENSFLKVLRILSLSFLFGVLILSVLVFFLTSRISPSSVVREEALLAARIKLLKGREAKIATRSDRIKGIGEILSKRYDFGKTIEVFLSNLPPRVSVDAFEAGKTNVALTVRSNSLLSLDTFIKNIINLVKNGKEVKSMTIENVSLDPSSGIYSLTIKADRL